VVTGSKFSSWPYSSMISKTLRIRVIDTKQLLGMGGRWVQPSDRRHPAGHGYSFPLNTRRGLPNN
jgi:hypothetical protein